MVSFIVCLLAFVVMAHHAKKEGGWQGSVYEIV